MNSIIVHHSIIPITVNGGVLLNGKSVRLQTLFSNALNYDWFIQSIFISNPLLTSSLVIVHHSNHSR
ncbi:MAG: hypothetical protein EWV52_10590 [Microcystis panniformis Mp_MB_F_20051200_S6D]|nr:MAG: hypothetical protein EWV52_10590 [Microcystis panniformis Mp_MB_F_20051200_S6D]